MKTKTEGFWRMRTGLLLMAVLAASTTTGCSFLVGSFNECTTAADCPSTIKDPICAKDGENGPGYCLPPTVHEGCRGVPEAGVAGRYGSDADNAIEFGVALPITSANGVNTRSVQNLNAMLLALEEINERSGVAGRQFALTVCDTGGSAEKASSQVAWMGDEGIVATIVPTSSAVLAAAQPAIDRRMVLMSPTATSVEVSSLSDAPDQGVGLVWRTVVSDAQQGRVIGDILKGDSGVGADAGFAGINSIGILYVDDAYGQGLNAAIVQRLNGSGKTVSSFQYTRNSESEITSRLQLLNAQNPGATVAIAFQEDAKRILNGALMHPNLKKPNHRWLFSDSAKDASTLVGLTQPSEVDGALGTTPAQGAGLAFTTFQDRFKAEFMADPSQFAFTSQCYDAFWVLALGAAHASGADGKGVVDGPRIAQGMTQLSAPSGPMYQLQVTSWTGAEGDLRAGRAINIVGASGNLDFDAVGDVRAPIEVWQITDSMFVTLTRVE